MASQFWDGQEDNPSPHLTQSASVWCIHVQCTLFTIVMSTGMYFYNEGMQAKVNLIMCTLAFDFANITIL